MKRTLIALVIAALSIYLGHRLILNHRATGIALFAFGGCILGWRLRELPTNISVQRKTWAIGESHGSSVVWTVHSNGRAPTSAPAEPEAP